MPSALVGRDKELDRLRECLDMAATGKGSTMLIIGEAGIGKSALIEELLLDAQARGFKTIVGRAERYESEPYHLLRSLKGLPEVPFLKLHEQAAMEEIFIINRAGIQLAHAGKGLEIDEHIYAGMLTAVRDFVKDSFGGGEGGFGLGKLEYEDKKILIESGDDVYIAAVIKGKEHPDMRRDVRVALEGLKSEYSELLQRWDGDMAKIAGIANYAEQLIAKRYPVKKTEADLEAEKLKLCETFTESIKAMAADQPLLIALDDLHWSDSRSLEVLHYLSRDIRDDPVLIVGTTRPSELDEAKQKALAEYETFELRTLGRECVAGLVQSMHGLELPDSLVEPIYERTAGNPLFVKELLQHLLESGVLRQRKDGKWVVDDRVQLELPGSIKETIGRRLERLSDAELRALEYAAVAGLGADQALLRAVGIDKPILDRLEAMRFLKDLNGGYHFDHPLIQQTIYETIGPFRKKAIHRTLGLGLESLYKEKPEDVAFELARHFNATTDTERIIKYNEMAGDLADAQFSPDKALDYYRAAIKGAKSIGDLKIEMKLLAKAAQAASPIGEWDYQLEASKRLLELAERMGDVSIQADALRYIAVVKMNQGELDKALDNLTRALRLCKGVRDSERIAKCYRQIGIVYGMKGLFEKSEGCLKKALKEAQEVNNTKEIARIYNVFGNIEWRKGNNAKAVKHLEKSLGMFERDKELDEIALLYNNIGYIYGEMSRYDEAIDYLEKSIKIAREVKNVDTTARALLNVADIHVKKGNLKKTLEYANEALKWAEKMDHKLYKASAYTIYSAAYRPFKEHWKLAIDYQHKAIEIAKGLDDLRFLAKVYSETAEMYKSMQKLKEAKKYHEKALKIHKTI